jgi:cell division protein FtsI/penicillin-binding protein 2
MNPQTGEVLAMVSLPSYDNNEFGGGISAQKLQALHKDPNRPLLNHAISYAKEEGIRKVGLYSYLKTRAFYEDSGFVEGERFVRYRGIPKARNERTGKP